MQSACFHAPLPINHMAARYQQELLDDSTEDTTPALRAMDHLAEDGFTTFQLGNRVGGGRALAERRAGAYLKSVGGQIALIATLAFSRTSIFYWLEYFRIKAI